jgi:drug/metabolite transporter (DMT)-like permease
MPGALPLLIPYGLSDFGKVWWRYVEPVTWAALFHVVFLAGVVGFLGFYRGVKQIGASATMLYQFLVPPLATTFGFVILRQVPTVGQGIGFAIVIAGVWYATVARQRVEARARAEAMKAQLVSEGTGR